MISLKEGSDTRWKFLECLWQYSPSVDLGWSESCKTILKTIQIQIEQLTKKRTLRIDWEPGIVDVFVCCPYEKPSDREHYRAVLSRTVWTQFNAREHEYVCTTIRLEIPALRCIKLPKSLNPRDWQVKLLLPRGSLRKFYGSLRKFYELYVTAVTVYYRQTSTSNLIVKFAKNNYKNCGRKIRSWSFLIIWNDEPTQLIAEVNFYMSVFVWVSPRGVLSQHTAGVWWRDATAVGELWITWMNTI